MRLSTACLVIVCVLCGASALAQEAGDATFADPSGLWVGQLTALGPNRAWYVNMTLGVTGQTARGIFEWVNLDAGGQTFTAFNGTWDPAKGQAVVAERVLFEERGVTEEASYTMQVSKSDPNVAWGTTKSPTVPHGGFHLIRAGAFATPVGFPGRWQSLPGTTNPALNLVFTDGEDGIRGEGTYLDREKRTLLPIRATAKPVQGQEGNWTVAIWFGEGAEAPARYTCQMEAIGCVLRLMDGGKTAALLVRRR